MASRRQLGVIGAVVGVAAVAMIVLLVASPAEVEVEVKSVSNRPTLVPEIPKTLPTPLKPSKVAPKKLEQPGPGPRLVAKPDVKMPRQPDRDRARIRMMEDEAQRFADKLTEGSPNRLDRHFDLDRQVREVKEGPSRAGLSGRVGSGRGVRGDARIGTGDARVGTGTRVAPPPPTPPPSDSTTPPAPRPEP